MPKKCNLVFNARQGADIPRIVTYYRELGGVHGHLQQCYVSDVGSHIRPFLGVADFVIWRQHSDERLRYDHPDAAEYARQLINTLKINGIDPDRVYLHGHNEAGIGDDVLKWELEFGKAVLALGGRVVLLNLNPGTPEKEDWAKCEQFVRWLGQNRDRAKLGLHEYFPVLFEKGRGHLIGRFNWLLEYLRSKPESFIPPAIFITEFGSDWVDASYQTTLPKTTPYGNVRGYKSLPKAYEKLLGLPLAEAYWQQVQQSYEQVYQNSVVEAVFLYNWNSKDGKFGAGREEEMDLSDDDAAEFRKLLKNWWKTMQTTTIITDLRPKKSEFDNLEPMVVETVDGRVNLRREASDKSEILLKIVSGDIVRVLKHPLWGKWVAICLQNESILEDKRIGFVHTDWIRFHTWNAPNQPPVEPSPNDRVAWQSHFTDTELKQIAYALAYGGDFPEVGSHYKKLIAKMVNVYEQLA